MPRLPSCNLPCSPPVRSRIKILSLRGRARGDASRTPWFFRSGLAWRCCLYVLLEFLQVFEGINKEPLTVIGIREKFAASHQVGKRLPLDVTLVRQILLRSLRVQDINPAVDPHVRERWLLLETPYNLELVDLDDAESRAVGDHQHGR